MAKIKKNDFIEIEYTAKIADSDIVFDTTDEKTAKEYGLFSNNARFGKIVVCVGEGQIVKGLENKLIGKEPGKYTIRLSPEEGFGKKSAKNIQLIPLSKFKKENIQPLPGMQVNVDNIPGIIKTVSGGRVLVDFNHPLASKELVYDITISRILEDDNEKAREYVKFMLNLDDADVSIDNGILKVITKASIPAEVQAVLRESLTKTISSVNDVKFLTEQESAKSSADKEKHHSDN